MDKIAIIDERIARAEERLARLKVDVERQKQSIQALEVERVAVLDHATLRGFEDNAVALAGD